MFDNQYAAAVFMFFSVMFLVMLVGYFGFVVNLAKQHVDREFDTEEGREFLEKKKDQERRLEELNNRLTIPPTKAAKMRRGVR